MAEYRTTAHVCPGCAGVMTETATAQALLDLCPDCGGLWIEWSDGDLQQMAQRVAAVRTWAPKNEPVAGAACETAPSGSPERGPYRAPSGAVADGLAPTAHLAAMTTGRNERLAGGTRE